MKVLKTDISHKYDKLIKDWIGYRT